MKTRLLSPADIYDLYGCEWVLQAANVEKEDLQIIDFRLDEIKQTYLAAAKSRIRAEAVYLGVKLSGNFSFSEALNLIKENIGNAIAKQSAETRGGPVNLMGIILQAHQSAGADLKGIDVSKFGIPAASEMPKEKDVDPNWFKKGSSKRMFDDPKWATIASAYLAIESARSNKEIISSIDQLNQLQHNSFHILIDLQTGRMLNEYENESSHEEARARLQEILDTKLHAKTPTEFARKMSPEIKSLLQKYRGAAPVRTR